MFNPKKTMVKFRSQILKASALAVTFTGLIQLIGCSSFPANIAQQQPSVSSGIESKPLNQPIATDVILYIGFPAHNGIRQKGSVIVGDKYSYLISTGSEQLNLLTELQPKNLHIQQPIKMYRYPDNSIYFELRFNYDSADGSYSNTEHRLLSQLCKATINKEAINNAQPNISAINRHSCKLTLQGGMYAALQNQRSTMTLNQGLAVEIYPTNATRAKTQAEIAVIPLNVVLETIELPFELLSIIK